MTGFDKAKYSKNPGNLEVILAATDTKWGVATRARRTAKSNARKAANESRVKFTAETQPRDYNGRFKKILARLKGNLGEAGTEGVAEKIQATEEAQVAGNYAEMRTHGNNLIDLIENIEEGTLKKGTVKNLRNGASDLSTAIAYLPLPQGEDTAKVRFTDVPLAMQEMVRSMVKQVEEQLDTDTAQKYISTLKSYMAGGRTMASDQLSEELNKLLRVLA